jgi:hypothetical protein
LRFEQLGIDYAPVGRRSELVSSSYSTNSRADGRASDPSRRLLEIPELLQECSPPILRYLSDIAERGGALRGHVLHDHGFDRGREIIPDIGEFVANRFDHFSVCDICHRDQTPRSVLARARRCSILPLELPTMFSEGIMDLLLARGADTPPRSVVFQLTADRRVNW